MKFYYLINTILLLILLATSKNEALIKELDHGFQYKFQVAIYQNNVWSELSDYSTIIDTRLSKWQNS